MCKKFVTGQFVFRFFDLGRWKKVAVDDRLPTQRRWHGISQLIFASNESQSDEYWIPLIEKAFVKYILISVGATSVTDCMKRKANTDKTFRKDDNCDALHGRPTAM